jgi:uncharacterized phage protein (TIGR02218 family)
MKTAPSALTSYLNALRASPDAPLYLADCFTFWLSNGSVLTYSSLDVPVALNGFTYLANSLQVSGLKYKASTGVNVDKQQITISAYPGYTIGGAPFLAALQQKLFDGAEIQRERVFFSSYGAVPPLVPIGNGSVILFKGRVSTIEEIGRTTAKVTVASDLVLLDIDMPRNLYAPTCNHVLYDAGCTLNRATYTASGVVGAGSSITNILWSGATSAYQQGALTFTSGANEGTEVTVKAASAGSLGLMYPLLEQPATGDAFTVCQGCDHTFATCKAKFNNLSNFRGFPYVPSPLIISGPLASTTSSRGK